MIEKWLDHKYDPAIFALNGVRDQDAHGESLSIFQTPSSDKT